MVIPNILYILRNLFFSLTAGISIYIVLLYSKPIIESVFKKNYSIDGYYWFIVLISFLVAIVALFIL
ncbi:MAG: hypothetical protein MCSN_2340 [Candidatus Microsyncoccus archaeolyticus]|nr:MAG: hypothetical protein MCSN_2340 [Candidatus Parcubacteria bacterium]